MHTCKAYTPVIYARHLFCTHEKPTCTKPTCGEVAGIISFSKSCWAWSRTYIINNRYIIMELMEPCMKSYIFFLIVMSTSRKLHKWKRCILCYKCREDYRYSFLREWIFPFPPPPALCPPPCSEFSIFDSLPVFPLSRVSPSHPSSSPPLSNLPPSYPVHPPKCNLAHC